MKIANLDGNRLVQTDMGNAGARAFGLDKATLTLEESSKNTAYIVSAVLHNRFK
jgi:hypothetical protein